MVAHALSEEGEGGSPPSAEPFSNNHAEAMTDDSVLRASKEAAREPGAETATSARVVDTDAPKLVDVVFLVDGTDRIRDVFNTLSGKLKFMRKLIRQFHPDVGIHVTFIGYRSYEHASVVQLNETFDEVLPISQRSSSGEHEAQDVLDGLKEVSQVRWSDGSTRLLVQVSDAPAPPPSRRASGSRSSDSEPGAARAALLRRLWKDCRLQAYYFVHFEDSTKKLIQEIRRDCGQPGWLISEQLDEPDTLPFKVAELVMALLKKVAAAGGGSAAAEEVPQEPSDPGVTSPVTPEPTPELPAEPTEAGTPHSPSQTSAVTDNYKIALQSEVNGAQPVHRYRVSSEDGTGHGAQDASPRSEAGAGHVTRGDGRPSEKGEGRAAPKTSSASGAATGQATPKSGPRSQAGTEHGALLSARPSEVGAGQGTAKGVPRSRAGTGHGALSSGQPSELGAGQGTPKGVGRPSELGAGQGTPKGVAPPTDDGSGHSTPRSNRTPGADAGQATPKTVLRSEVGSTHGAQNSSPPAEAGAGQATPKTVLRSEAGAEQPLTKSGPASEASSGQGTPRSGPRSEAGGDATHRSGSRSVAGSGRGSGKSGPPSESSLGAASSEQLLSDAWSAGSHPNGAPLSQQASASDARGPSTRVSQLPWSARALEDFKAEMKRTSFALLSPADDPLTARLDAVFAMPQELWPVLPPGALYCLEAYDPRVGFGYLQHRDFPTTKVRISTYFGKWCRHLVDYVVSWQPVPRAEAAWQPADGKQPPLPWEPRQVVAHTTHGEYQYANTRIKFRGPRSAKPGAEEVEWSDAHGIDLLDTKAANETAPRNSDKDREAHLIDPPRPNTWGEMARRPLIGSLRSRGGGAYVHHVNYDHSGLRTRCGRRVPAGYYFTLVPAVTVKPPPVPGGPSCNRPSSVGRAIAAARQSRPLPNTASTATATATATSAAAAAVNAVAYAISALRCHRGVSLVGPSEDGPVPAAAGLSQRPSSAGARRLSRAGSEGTGPGPSGLTRRGSGTGRGSSLLGGSPSPATPSPTKVGWSAGQQSAGQGTRASAAAVAGVDVVCLAPRERWRTYDVPMDHPLNSARAQDLAAEEARASGRDVRGFSDAAAVMKVAEQELRLARPFVPGPLVVPSWDDIPRLYVEHMEAARQLMPVTELDTYGTSKMHMLLYHLQCAATLEYDRLDAKLLLLPQMARLGRKSAEIDAWLQALVEHASYLYDKLEISEAARWAPAGGGAEGTAAAAATAAAPLRSSVAAAPPQAALVAAAAAAATAPGASQGWVFPDPLRGTVHASRSAVNLAAQVRPSLQEQRLPAVRLTHAEWSTITAILDPARHATLYDVWVRLRPVMTGAGAAAGSGYAASGGAGSSLAGVSSDACATASGFGDVKPSASTLGAVGGPDPYYHGSVNQEVLDYLPQDIAAMSAPDFVPPPPPPAKLPKHRGYRGEGPLPPELVADMPVVHKPVRCRGADETPLPATYHSMDIWNFKTKADLTPARSGGPGGVPHPRDAGATRSSQVAVLRLQAAREFAKSQQGAVRKSMQLAKGEKPFDDPDAPYYGSDVAEDDFSSEISSARGSKAATPRGRVRSTAPHSGVSGPGGNGPTAAHSAPYSAAPSAGRSHRAGTATQTTQDLGQPTPEERAMEAERSRAATEAAEIRQSLLRGKSYRSRDQILDEALRSAEAAIRSLQHRPVGSVVGAPRPYPNPNPHDEPDSPRLLLVREEPRDAALQPHTRGPPRIEHSNPEVLPYDWYMRGPAGTVRRRGSEDDEGPDWSSLGSPSAAVDRNGPEPFSLEKIWREPYGNSEVDFGVVDVPMAQLPVANFHEPKLPGYGGLVDYEMAMSRRRAIAGAEAVHLEGDFISKSDVLNLLVVYCNIDRQPDQVELLQRTIDAPVNLRAMSAAAAAANANAMAAGPTAAIAAAAAAAGKSSSARQADMDSEAERQRIRSTAWLLGVTWRRITNETYTSFLCRVLGWPAEAADAMHRTRATHLIARALVRGHDMRSVPKASSRH